MYMCMCDVNYAGKYYATGRAMTNAKITRILLSRDWATGPVRVAQI